MLVVATALLLIFAIVVFVWVLSGWRGTLRKLGNCSLYAGRVKHTRLKGGAVHHLDYPIFFAYVDLDEINTVGWELWPIFKVNSKSSFCSLDSSEHLKGWDTNKSSILERVDSFLKEKSGGKLNSVKGARLLTHLSYFGYCFNPISIYFIQHYADSNSYVDTVIAEVSNTPWIEQHSYALNEAIDDVTVKRTSSTMEATWFKAFHVSPFMEMDYKYNFIFHEPGETLAVQAKMLKVSTNEVWFTASFQLHRMDFNIPNLLYVLLFYPLHTRMIQLWIHYEALLIFLKGVPTFQHPEGTDVDFGFGITGQRIANFFSVILAPFYFVLNLLRSPSGGKSNKND